MSTSLRILAVSALVATNVAMFTGAAGAAPIGQPLAFIKAVPSTTQSVQWRGGWGWGAPVAGGLIAGAIIGGALAAPYGPGYYPGPGYYGGPGYGPPPGVAYRPPPVEGDGVAYCMQRFKSYDPNSGTYLGYDGNRHPCP
ncbi:MAG: BA14K family protein [Bradyrhizobium sp.]